MQRPGFGPWQYPGPATFTSPGSQEAFTGGSSSFQVGGAPGGLTQANAQTNALQTGGGPTGGGGPSPQTGGGASAGGSGQPRPQYGQYWQGGNIGNSQMSDRYRDPAW